MAPVRAEVTINLSIQLSDNTDAEQIDAIFDSLARHILWREKDEVLPKEDDFDDLEEESPEEPHGENE